MKRKKFIILIIIFVQLLITGAVVLRTHKTDNPSLIKDSNATPWNGEQSLPREAWKSGYIVPGNGYYQNRTQ